MTIARIGRFAVERVLGSGSFATVWLARDEDLDGWVAIKLLAENWSLNEDARTRFLEEARALRRLDDERIVRVYEIGRLADDRPYMVMEFADRGTLEDRMRLRVELDQPFSIREAVELGSEIAECLIAVHGCRMVHRDVKPSNVLFRTLSRERQEAMRRNGQPVATERTLLGDFGIARRLEGPLRHTAVLGSPQYMSPEQADPVRAREVDGRSDIYSAAVIVYELLAREVPEGPAARSLRHVRADVPAALAAVIDRGLSTDRDDRFESAWEWRDALRAGLLEASPGRVTTGRVRASVPTVDVGSTEPLRVPDPVMASLGAREASTAATVQARGGSRAPTTATAPAATRRGTDVLPPPPGSEPGRRIGGPVRAVDLRLAAAAVMFSALAVIAGVLLPWSSDSAGTGHSQSSMVAGASAAMLLAGLRMWRARRRWVAASFSTLAAAAGLASASLGLFVIVRIVVREHQSIESGPLVIVMGGLLAFAAGARAVKRLRPAQGPRLPAR